MPKQANRTEPKFAQIDNRVLDLLEQDCLTKTERRLFWYLFKLDRFGDRFVKLPSQGDIAKHLGVRRETINLAQAKLQKLGLFDFQVDGWKARNLVAPKSNTVLDKSLRVLEKSNSQLENSDTQLDFDNSQLENSDTHIYIDRARDRSISDLNSDLLTDLNQITPLPSREQEGERAFEVEVEILDPEIHHPPRSVVQPESESKPTEPNPKPDKSSEARDNKARRPTRTVDELIELFESGEVKFPRHELRILAHELIGNQVALYRKSGDICCARPNDIDQGFAAYVESKLGVKLRDRANAISRIRNCEQDPLRWRELVEMVEGWQRSQQSPVTAPQNGFDPEFMAILMAAGK